MSSPILPGALEFFTGSAGAGEGRPAGRPDTPLLFQLLFQ